MGGLVLPTGGRLISGERGGALAVLSFYRVDLAFRNRGWAVSGWILAVVSAILDVDLGVDVALVRFTVAMEGGSVSNGSTKDK